MKNLVFLGIIFLFSSFQVSLAQNGNTTQLLNYYLALKQTLVNAEAKKAAESANNMLKFLHQAQAKNWEANDLKTWTEQKVNAIKAIQKIAQTTDIEKQRVALAELSPILWIIFKTSPEVENRLYYDYCPMKKAYWISADESIKNPYYGSKMLTCGKISEKNR